MIRYKNGAPPRIILSNDSGDTETIRIDNWKAEHIAEYLTERMKTTVTA